MDSYIGLDAHSKTCTFVVLDKNGREIRTAKVDTSEKNILGFLSTIQGVKKLVFEEANLSQWLYMLLKDKVDELTVCNASYLAKKQGAKNDYRDALHLANELRCGHVIPVFHDDHPLMRLRTVFSYYTETVKNCTRAKNRIKSILRANGIKTESIKKRTFSTSPVIEELKNSDDQFVANALAAQIDLLTQQKLEYLKIFEEYKQKHLIIKNLSTIPGVGIVRAVTISSSICSAERFVNKHKLWSYSMLVRHVEESDGVIYGMKTKYGRTELKGAFIGAAENVNRSDNSLSKYYQQLRSKGLNHKAARKSVARRIAAISLHIMKHGGEYDDKHIAKKSKEMI